MKRLVIFALLLSFVVCATSIAALAEDKMHRAAKNTVFGWTEIPKTIVKVTKDSDNPFLGITVGLLKGIGNAFARTTSGVADVVTMPAQGQQEPIVKETMIPVESSTKK
jgi:putative exosortase-associated protein (TIGR04073 family)